MFVLDGCVIRRQGLNDREENFWRAGAWEVFDRGCLREMQVFNGADARSIGF